VNGEMSTGGIAGAFFLYFSNFYFFAEMMSVMQPNASLNRHEQVNGVCASMDASPQMCE
jgi:hypothetical protein